MMGVLWLRARAQLRGRALANLFLVLLVGLAGALVLAAAAGARRSEAALPWFLAANQTVDAAVFVETKGPTDDLTEAPTPPIRLDGIDSSARSPSTRAAVSCSAARSWSPAGCPTSAGQRRWWSTRS
jgi:hypothetical protein